eukprot:COSAG01_NODE_5388_length_4291_cov_5.223760_6_plen_87_part_00
MIGRLTPTLEVGGRTVNESHRASMTGVREFGGFKGRRHSSVACVGQLGTGILGRTRVTPSASARADSAPRRFRCASLLLATDSAQK